MSQTQVITSAQERLEAKRDEERFQEVNKDDWKKYDKRTLWQVLATDIQNYVYFFTPLVIIHSLAWMIKPLFTNNPESPWVIIWDAIVDFWGNDAYNLYVYGTLVTIATTMITTASIYAYMDYTQSPKFLMKYKVQTGKNTPPDTKKMMKVIVVVAFNELLTAPMLIVGFDGWREGPGADLRYVPDLYTSFLHIFVAMLLHDVSFYHFHRALHHRKLYKHIHKIHHEFQSPMAAVSTYAHPVEHFLTGVLGPSLGPMLMGSPLPVHWAWFMWLVVQTMNDHSGYHFPLAFSPEFHDYHHLKFHTSYGWLTFWDWFYGTDIEFVKNEVHNDRHIRIHSTKSAKELFPDPVKKSK